MENKKDVAFGNLRWTKNENNENLEEPTEKGRIDKTRSKGLHRNKRVPLGTLSNSCLPFQTRSKLTSVRDECEYYPDNSELEKHPHTKICNGVSHQKFSVYIDQEHVPWPSVHMTVETTSSDINDKNSDGNGSCEEEINISDINISGVTNSCADGDSDSNLLEYETEIYEYLKEAEKKHRPRRNFMSGQPLINKSMRAILVDWLVEVAEEYTLVPETLFLTVNYLDRFLSSKVIIDPSKLQLVGISCMLIASKMEEIYPPEISEFVYITNSTYTGDEVKQMENIILESLAFDLAVPTVQSFLDKYERSFNLPARITEKFSYLTKYYCEVVLQDVDFQWRYLPSLIAASSVALALHTLESTASFTMLSASTGYQLCELKSCVKDIYGILIKVEYNSLQAIKDKYSHDRFGCVATIATRRPVFA